LPNQMLLTIAGVQVALPAESYFPPTAGVIHLEPPSPVQWTSRRKACNLSHYYAIGFDDFDDRLESSQSESCYFCSRHIPIRCFRRGAACLTDIGRASNFEKTRLLLVMVKQHTDLSYHNRTWCAEGYIFLIFLLLLGLQAICRREKWVTALYAEQEIQI
jgi:hypothetical protein